MFQTSLANISVTIELWIQVFWVISVQFDLRNTLPKFGPFLLLHSVYSIQSFEHKCSQNYVSSEISTIGIVVNFCFSAIQNRENFNFKKEVKVQLECTAMTPLVSDHFQGEVLYGILVGRQHEFILPLDKEQLTALLFFGSTQLSDMFFCHCLSEDQTV